MFNARDEARRAEGGQHGTERSSRRRLQHACWPSDTSFADEFACRAQNKAVSEWKKSANASVVDRGAYPHISVGLVVPEELNLNLITVASLGGNLGRVNAALPSPSRQLRIGPRPVVGEVLSENRTCLFLVHALCYGQRRASTTAAGEAGG